MRPTALAAALALQLIANVAGCGFTMLGDLPAVLATCCESVEPSDCTGSFPASCTTGCAELLVPFRGCQMKRASFPPTCPPICTFNLL
jgi:hypothetical protein